MKKLVDSPKKIIALVTGLLILLAGAFVLPFIPIQNDIKELFTGNSKEHELKKQLNSTFEKQPNVLVLTITENQPFAFQSKEKLKKLQLLSDSLACLDQLDTVFSIVSVKIPKLIGASLFYKPLINLNKPHLDTSDWNLIQRFKDITPLFVNSDWSQTNLFISLKKDFVYNEPLTTQLENTAANYGFSNSKVVGNAVFDHEIKTRIEKDIFRLALYGFIIIMIAFWLFFRSLSVIIFIGFMVGINVNASILFTWMLGVEFNIMTAIIPTLIAILSVTDLNHILHIYKENEHIEEAKERISRSLKRIKYALVMTSLTTAIGFSIFLVSDVQTIIDFGIIAILSIGFALFTAWYLAPYFVMSLPIEKIKLLKVKGIQTILMNAVANHSRKLSVLFIGVFILTGVFTFYNWNVNYIIYDDLEKNSALENSYKKFNDQFQGTRQIEIIFTTTKDSIVHLDNINLLEETELFLKKKMGYKFTNSYTNFLKNYNRTLEKGRPEDFQLPKNTEIMEMGIQRSQEQLPASILNQFISKDGKSFKISAFKDEILSSKGIQELDSIHQFLSHILSSTDLTFSIQGPSYSRDYSTTNISNTIIYGIFVSIGIISLLMALTFKSLLVGLIAWLVNLLPVFVSISILFLLGYHITPAIAMMLSISFGIALDDTIYFLGLLKSNKKDITKDSLVENIETITFPVLSTSIILSLSFCALFFSSFSFNITNGLIIICTLMIAMICDLLFLPSLLHLLKKNNLFEY